MAAHLHMRHIPSPGMDLIKQQGFHLMTHQLEIDCYDERHARASESYAIDSVKG